MYKTSVSLTAAAGLAVIGMIVAFIAAFLVFDAQGDDMLLSIALLLLIAVLFLGVAGGLSENGQWSWSMTVFMIFLCAIVTVAAYLYGAVDLEIAVVLTAIALITAALASTGSSKATLS